MLMRKKQGNLRDSVRETLLSPDRVVRSKSDDDVSLFYRFYKTTIVGPKFMCVVVILTAYYSERIKKGEVIWQIGKK